MKEMQAFMEGFKIQFDSYSPGFIEWTIFLALAGYILYRFWLFLNDPSHKKPHRAKILSHKSFNKKILKTVQWPEKEIPVMEEFLKMQEIVVTQKKRHLLNPLISLRLFFLQGPPLMLKRFHLRLLTFVTTALHPT